MRALLLFAPVLLLGARPAPPPIAYELSPELTDGAITALEVTARFRGAHAGVTRFDWPDSWAGEAKLGQWARDLHVAGARSTSPAPHGGIVIRAAPDAALTVTYRVVSAFAADPSVADSEQAKPVVRPGWFYAVGEALFAVPENRDDDPVAFAWRGPTGIGFASDLEHANARRGRPKTVQDLTESIVIGGRDLRVTTVEAGGAPLRIATLGRYGFDLAAFEALAQKVLAAERTFWRDRDGQPFLITMTPLTPVVNRLSYGGTGRSDAFALWMDPAAPLPGLAWLLAHEYFHGWNPRQLGRTPDGAVEGEAYWFSEGFTDFYARRLMLRAGLLTPAEFAESWNETLRAYGTSKWRDAGNARAAKAFWTDEGAEKLPYQRGAMLAALWDRRVGLDAVLRDQRRRASALRRPPLATALFVATAKAHGLVVGPDLLRYVERGEALRLPAYSFGRCAAVAIVTRPTFERGYDPDATAKAGNVVTGLDPRSPAYAAGLRDGMKIVGRKGGKPGDARVDYALEVADDAGTRLIRFRPEGRGTETFQELQLDAAAFAATPAACVAALAG